VRIYATLGVFPMIGVSVLMVWRHRWPIRISIIATAAALLLPSTPLPAMIALAALVAVRTGWLRWVMVTATFAATVVSFCWDVASTTSFIADFAGKPAAGTPDRIALFWVTPVLAAFAVAPFVAFGIIRKIRAERDSAQRVNQVASRNLTVLQREVDLERDRQELARELHDTLAARLSALSLHAGALELTVGDKDQKATEAARAVRQSAQDSLDELRHTVKALRNPSAATGTSTGLAQLPALIDGALRDGTDVRAQILVTDPSSCDPHVAHACYRLIQEAISNVRRHAPGAALRVDLRGTPETGLTINALNWLMPGGRPADGQGHGLQGMSERVALVGGSFQAGFTPQGAFAIAAWLPWVPR
jgi:signal transduction histidine kinase